MDNGIDDYKLIGNIISGNSEDFKVLVGRYKKLVSHIIYRIVSDPAEIDDLGQEIFIRIYHALPKFEFRSNLATWISKIAYNCCINYNRKKELRLRTITVSDNSRQNDVSNEIETLNSISKNYISPEDELTKIEINSFLNKAINTLPVKFRKIITFRYLDNMSHNEISEIMDIPVGSVKGYLFRARKLLKDELLANYDMEDICL
jgi:RNA polymerase sigma-70 factor (ECF subfamily)